MVKKVVSILFVIALIYVAITAIIYHQSLIKYPYPVTLREGAMMSSTLALVHGFNPYAFNIQPMFTNTYGIMYPLFVVPFAKIWGVTLFSHRLVTGLFILAISFMVFFVIHRKLGRLSYAFWGALFVYASMLYPTTSTPTVDPGAMGAFFILAAIYIPYLARFKLWSLLVSVVFVLIGFYTKPYACMGFIIVGIFLAFKRMWPQLIVYFGCIICLGLLSIKVVDHLLPAYFDNCFWSHVHFAAEMISYQRLRHQTAIYSLIHVGVLALLLIFISVMFRRFRFQLQDIFAKLDIEIVAIVFMLIILIFSLGKHSGAYLWYYFQLLSPFLLIFSAVFLGGISERYIIIPIVLALNITIFSIDHHFKIDNEGWGQVKELVKSDKAVYTSSLIAPLLIEENKFFLDNGHSEYFEYGSRRKKSFGFKLQEDNRVHESIMAYLANINTLVEERKFDFGLLQGVPPSVTPYLNEHYEAIGLFELFAAQDRLKYKVIVWAPKHLK